MGSDVNLFNVSFITVRDKVTRQCPQITTFEEKGEAEADSNRGPSAYQPNALQVRQTGSYAFGKAHIYMRCNPSLRNSPSVSFQPVPESI